MHDACVSACVCGGGWVGDSVCVCVCVCVCYQHVPSTLVHSPEQKE